MSRRPSAREAEDAERHVRALMRREGNRYCADCGDRSPLHVCLPLGTFVCTMCSGIHRDAGRRVKHVESGLLTMDDVDRLEARGGNSAARQKWMARWNARDFPEPPPGDVERAREFIWLKYEGSWAARPPSGSRGGLGGGRDEYRRGPIGDDYGRRGPPPGRERELDRYGGGRDPRDRDPYGPPARRGGGYGEDPYDRERGGGGGFGDRERSRRSRKGTKDRKKGKKKGKSSKRGDSDSSDSSDSSSVSGSDSDSSASDSDSDEARRRRRRAKKSGTDKGRSKSSKDKKKKKKKETSRNGSGAPLSMGTADDFLGGATASFGAMGLGAAGGMMGNGGMMGMPPAVGGQVYGGMPGMDGGMMGMPPGQMYGMNGGMNGGMGGGMGASMGAGMGAGMAGMGGGMGMQQPMYGGGMGMGGMMGGGGMMGETGRFISALGVSTIVSQALLARPLVALFGERPLIVAGFVLSRPALLRVLGAGEPS
eukprot:contig_22896_g5655